MHTEFGFFSAAQPLGPGITQQAVGQHAKVMGGGRGNHDLRELGPEAVLLQNDPVRAGRQIAIHGSAGPGASLVRAAVGSNELKQDIGQGNVAFIADMAKEHDSLLSICEKPNRPNSAVTLYLGAAITALELVSRPVGC
jgi:hypothetical protein